MRIALLKLPLLFLTIISFTVQASYKWVDADDLHLRSDIQLLADLGVIKVPTTTYPLMWSGVMEGINGINNVDFNDLSEQAKSAYYRVQAHYESINKANNTTSISIAAASDTPRFQHYGSSLREKGEITLRTMGEVDDWFAYNLQGTYAFDAQDDETYRFDGSYISALAGNWILTAGSYGEWYGPGWDSGLIKTTNARSLPSLSIARNKADIIDLPVLRWLGPWTLTTGISWMNDDDYREIKNALLWSFRTSFKPHPNLEFGISRTAQICGDGKDCGFETWRRMLIGDTNVEGGEENPANQLASVDFRWGDTFKSIPYGIYGEVMGEDDFRFEYYPTFGKKVI